MTKTSTPTHTPNVSNTAAETPVDEAEKQDLLFYDSIKPKLNELVKDPSDETINKILAYSKQK